MGYEVMILVYFESVWAIKFPKALRLGVIMVQGEA